MARWAKEGRIRFIRVGEGDSAAHRYNTDDLRRIFARTIAIKEGQDREVFLYARVSSPKQKQAGDLERQIDLLKQHCPDHHRVVTDVGSGLNFKRSGFLTVLDAVEGGRVEKVVVAHKDRLARFGLDLIYRTFAKYNCTLDVVSKDDDHPDASKPDELAGDLLAVCNFFVAQNNGRRAASNRRNRLLEREKVSKPAAIAKAARKSSQDDQDKDASQDSRGSPETSQELWDGQVDL